MIELVLQAIPAIFLPMGRTIYRRLPRGMRKYIELESDLGLLLSFSLGAAAVFLSIWLLYALAVSIL